MTDEDSAVFYRKREKRELAASGKSNDAMIKRLHWEMAQRYAFLASEAEQDYGTGSALPLDARSF